jgi:DNA-binding transcriptional ArsR family regulator
MSPQALHWHLARLVGAGLVRKERAGRVVRHFTLG